ncbi:MAG: septation protein SepH [Gordonia sp. (in: high G+C Gram-positive bacteria)]|uniref:septation protein SepH n=1 Tax=Gordonia sp. (in: high G+C Gram-positive bacteria) TaxID=84139 RepID=UPI0039E45DE9
MRDLEVLRVESDGQYVICIDRDTDEHFRIRTTDTLRVVRGETPEPPPAADGPALRPREIQARIRAGASVEELAEIAGVSYSKVDRYAHPVLLERARAAELARASHPVEMGGPVVATLGELVAECLVLRGETPADARWDAWKAPDGQWVVQVSVDESCTPHTAHWRYTPGSHGGTTEPIDELAVELTDPELARASRRNRISTLPTARTDRADEDDDSGPNGRPSPLAAVVDLQSAPDPDEESDDSRPEDTGDDEDEIDEPDPLPADEDDDVAEPAAPAKRPIPTPGDLAKRGKGGKNGRNGSRHRAKRGKPVVPAWEDVLLGVRAHDD